MIQNRAGFSIGDRVEFIAEIDPDGKIVRGMTGTVHSLEICYKGRIGVRWDNLSRLGPPHRFRMWINGGVLELDESLGWWVPADQIRRLDDIQLSDGDLDEMIGGLCG